MAKAYGEVLRGVREGTCTSCGTPRAELIHIRFTPDTDIRRCSECGGQTRWRSSSPPRRARSPTPAPTN